MKDPRINPEYLDIAAWLSIHLYRAHVAESIESIWRSSFLSTARPRKRSS